MPELFKDDSEKKLFCANCGNSILAQDYVCMSCGAIPTAHRKYCRHCGATLNAEQVICVKCNEVIEVEQSDNFASQIGQNCLIGGIILIPVGIVLCLIGSYMQSENKALLRNVESADIAVRSANQNLTAPHVVTDWQRQEESRKVMDATDEWSEANQRMLKNSHSTGLIYLLFVGGGFLIMFGFVLTVVGWVIPKK